MKESFESLYEYQQDNKKVLVQENLILEADDKSGPIGTIIDRGLSFVPRAVRFKKAKKTMKIAIHKFDEKSRKVIDASKKSISKRVDKIEQQYKDFMATKVKPLVDAEKYSEAVSLVNTEMAEYEGYKKDMLAQLEKSVDNVLSEYTKAIETRIDKPGFVFNVELSDKGKGELKAKWQELVSVQRLKIDEYKMEIASASGLSRLDEMISKMKGFVAEKKYSYGSSYLELYVDKVTMNPGSKTYNVHVWVRAAASRLKVEAKGLVWGDSPDLKIGEPGVKAAKETKDPKAFRVYWMTLSGVDENTYVAPWMQFFGDPTIQYGPTEQLKDKMGGSVSPTI